MEFIPVNILLGEKEGGHSVTMWDAPPSQGGRVEVA